MHTILFVDDDPQIRELVFTVLSDAHHTVLLALDGYEALQILASKPVDLMITDIRMPGMDGLQLAHEAKRLYPKVGVIYLSGYPVSASDAVVLQKPVRMTELVSAVRDQMAR
jgi:two-component system response regulator AtoC